MKSTSIVYFLLQLLLFSFLLVSPFANEVDWAIILMALLLFVLVVPALRTLVQAKRPTFEILAFLPMLVISIIVGLKSGNIPSNVVRGTIPYVIYIVSFAAVLYLPSAKRLMLARWYVIVAAMVSFKTMVLMASNGVTPIDVLHGVRATFFDINSGLSISMAAVPFVIVCFKNKWLRALLLFLLVGQVVLGQSKSLMVLTAAFLAVFFVVYIPKSRFVFVRALMIAAKAIAAITVLAAVVVTFNQNPLLQRFTLMVTNPKTELSGRIYEINNVLKVIDDRPLLGTGQGFVFIHKAADSPDSAPVYEERRYTHSVLFYHIAIMGFLGMPFAMLMLHGPGIYMALAMAGHWLRRQHSGHNRKRGPYDAYFLPVMMSSLGLMAFNLVSASYKNPQSVILLGFMNALAFTLLAKRKRFLIKPAPHPSITGEMATGNQSAS